MTDGDVRVIPANEATWEQIHVGAESVFAAAGLSEVGRPGKRRLVMRIDFRRG